MRKLYPVLIISIYFACNTPNLNKPNPELQKEIDAIHWVNTYHSLDSYAFSYYKTLSGDWKQNGFTYFGWQDSCWHFIFGKISYSLNADHLIKIKDNKIIQ